MLDWIITIKIWLSKNHFLVPKKLIPVQLANYVIAIVFNFQADKCIKGFTQNSEKCPTLKLNCPWSPATV